MLIFFLQFLFVLKFQVLKIKLEFPPIISCNIYNIVKILFFFLFFKILAQCTTFLTVIVSVRYISGYYGNVC